MKYNTDVNPPIPALVVMTLWSLLVTAIVLGAGYVAWHFITKFW